MIIITNQSEKDLLGRTKYHIKINNEFICEFWHKREEGLGACLLAAAKAVEKTKWEDFYKKMKR